MSSQTFANLSNDSIGIREKGNLGAGSKLGEQRLRGWADDVMKHLDSGMSPPKAKAWINERLAAA